MTERPYTLIAELTHRCPLACGYCSNPVAERAPDELAPAVWLSVLEQARELGIVQVHFTGGEPLLYTELSSLVERASALGLCSQLVTSAIGLSERRLGELAFAGLTSIQISLHELGARAWPPPHALRAAYWARELGLPLTLNFVLHRGNIDRTRAAIELAERLGADRLELANVQYLGWAFGNRDALLPTEDEIGRAREIAREARERLRGELDLVFVRPDLHSGRPRACMQGWGRRFIVVAPDGLALPCHAAKVLDLSFDSVASRALDSIWFESESFQAFRGDAWMREPCRSCDRKSVDFGGCRCQAKLLADDPRATDPACALSPEHSRMRQLVASPRQLVQLRPRQLA